MIKRDEIQNVWEKIVELGFSNYNTLNRNQRIWFNIESITTGGLTDHYINFGAENNSDLLEDLEYLGFKEIKKLFTETNSFFPNNSPPKDINERNEIIINWDEKTQEKFELNDSMFWEKCNSLEEALLSHIQKNIRNIENLDES